MRRKFKDGRAYTSTLKGRRYRSIIVMRLLKKFFLYLKYRINYRQIGPKHTPKMFWYSNKTPKRISKIRAAGYQ